MWGRKGGQEEEEGVGFSGCLDLVYLQYQFFGFLQGFCCGNNIKDEDKKYREIQQFVLGYIVGCEAGLFD